MMLNKKGAYVLDCKRDREIQSIASKDKETNDVLSLVKQYFNQNPQGSTATPPPTVEPSPAVTADSAVTSDHVRGLLANLG
jgi:hypothetical protein